MRIIELQAENYKRLVAVTIRPDGAIVDVNGRNGAGKSSTLDAIFAALAGQSAIPSKPIRKGEDKASIVIKMGDDDVELIVRRSFQATEDGDYKTSLIVENGKGARYTSPQAMLDGLLGALSFDPLGFTRMDAKEQLQELRALVPGVDFDALDTRISEAFTARTEKNREVKRLKTLVESMAIPGDPRVTRVDESALVAELNAAGEQKAEIERERARRRELQETAGRMKSAATLALGTRKDQLDRIEELREEIAELEARAAAQLDRANTITKEAEKLEAELAALPPLDEPPATAELMARIDAARKTNADVAERERALQVRAEREAHLNDAEAEAERLTKVIEDAKKAKVDAIAAAELPVPGLGFGDDEVLLNGLPLEQASDAEKLRVSVAIAAAMNPTLRVIRVRDGSLLDDDGRALLAEFAEKHGLQVWLERVATGAAVGIRIEDGRVASVGEVAA